MAASLAERLTATLRDRVITGVLAPGTVVIEPALAREFQVSKTPVREALQRLTHDGLIEVLPKRGYLVRAMTQADLRDVIELRELLEPLAAAQVSAAVSRRGPAAEAIVDALRQALEAQRAATRHDERVGAALRFHRTLAELTPNARLRAPLARALDETTRALYVLPAAFEERRDDEGLAEHEALFAAIESGDAGAAEVAAGRHFARLRPAAGSPTD
ncbi:MAG: GntR family transcriptional regulator [Arthrobacter sp.]|nr:GntR family transcriptional regulator [Arthrobacter sp.]